VKKRVVAATLTALLGMACGLSGGDPCEGSGACAPKNSQRIPNVIGMGLKQACPALKAKGYSGGVRRIIPELKAPAHSVLSLGTTPGTHGFEGQVIMMDISGGGTLSKLPKGCVSRLSKDS
jgi:hypothetical protein